MAEEQLLKTISNTQPKERQVDLLDSNNILTKDNLVLEVRDWTQNPHLLGAKKKAVESQSNQISDLVFNNSQLISMETAKQEVTSVPGAKEKSREDLLWCPEPGCSKYFSQKSNLTRHIRTHTNEKPYGCNYCTMYFSSSSNLNTHLTVHGKKPTKKRTVCSIPGCTKTFRYDCTIENHIKSQHPWFYSEFFQERLEKGEKFHLIFKEVTNYLKNPKKTKDNPVEARNSSHTANLGQKIIKEQEVTFKIPKSLTNNLESQTNASFYSIDSFNTSGSSSSEENSFRQLLKFNKSAKQEGLRLDEDFFNRINAKPEVIQENSNSTANPTIQPKFLKLEEIKRSTFRKKPVSNKNKKVLMELSDDDLLKALPDLRASTCAKKQTNKCDCTLICERKRKFNELN